MDDDNSRNSDEGSLNIPLTVESGRQIKTITPFSETIGKFDEIQLEIEKIREVWLEGYNYRTKAIKKIEPLIRGSVQLDSFINNYWGYFTSSEKIRLITQAHLLKWYLSSIDHFTFRKWLKIVF